MKSVSSRSCVRPLAGKWISGRLPGSSTVHRRAVEKKNYGAAVFGAQTQGYHSSVQCDASIKRKALMKTILVLEDELSLMMLMRRTLKQYNLIEATTAEQALCRFREHGRQPDLLVADVTLPGRSGIRVALLLSIAIPDVPVILTSGYPVSAWSDRDAADLERLGSRSVTILPKPFQAEELSNAVRELLAPRGEKTRTA
jgi:CheY-like chemotaxis protein